MYLCSISHSICSLIIFLGGMNIFLRISTSSVCNAALVIRLRIFMIFTIASWREGGRGRKGEEGEEGEEREEGRGGGGGGERGREEREKGRREREGEESIPSYCVYESIVLSLVRISSRYTWSTVLLVIPVSSVL